MANSTSNIDNIISGQAMKEVTANAFFDATSPASLYGRRASTCGGLVWGYYGGNAWINGPTSISNGTLTLTASTTTYIEADATSGAIAQNVIGFTAGRVPLYAVVTGSATVTSYTDFRVVNTPQKSLATVTLTESRLLTRAEATCDILLLTGSLGASVNLIVPARPWLYTIINNSGNTVVIKTASGSGTVSVANTKAAQVISDGTQVIRVTADT